MEAPTKAAKAAGKNIGTIKASKTINMPVSYWALLEQIRSRMVIQNGSAAMMHCIMTRARTLGLETG